MTMKVTTQSFTGTQPSSFIHIVYGGFHIITARRIVITETIGPIKPKIFTIWSFIVEVS